MPGNQEECQIQKWMERPHNATGNGCSSYEWAMAFMSGKKPEFYDGWMYMLHGDMGEDNTSNCF